VTLDKIRQHCVATDTICKCGVTACMQQQAGYDCYVSVSLQKPSGRAVNGVIAAAYS